MSTIINPAAALAMKCSTCAEPIAEAALMCSYCNALVHAKELEEQAQAATAAEQRGELAAAADLWSASLRMLPENSRQAAWIHDKVEQLRLLHSQQNPPPPPPAPAWTRRLGPFAPVAILLLKAKGLLLAIFKLKFLFSFLAFFGVYWGIFGWKFAAGLTISILIHEMGHFLEVRRRGLPADMPVFLPGLGAYVRWRAIGVKPEQHAIVSLAGPLAGWIAAAASLLLYAKTGNSLWAAIAHIGALLNIINLIPVWQLDGATALTPLGRTERVSLLVFTGLLWVLTGEGVFFLVMAGMVWRLFTKDLPKKSNPWICMYFGFLLAALGVVLHLAPDLAR